MLQEILVYIILILTGLFLIYSVFFKNLKKKPVNNCGKSCTGCACSK